MSSDTQDAGFVLFMVVALIFLIAHCCNMSLFFYQLINFHRNKSASSAKLKVNDLKYLEIAAVIVIIGFTFSIIPPYLIIFEEAGVADNWAENETMTQVTQLIMLTTYLSLIFFHCWRLKTSFK